MDSSAIISFRGEGGELQKMVVVGETRGTEKAFTFSKKSFPIPGVDSRMDSLLIYLSKPHLVREGDILYIVEKHPDHNSYKSGTTIGQVTVKSVFQMEFQGTYARAEGYLRNIEQKFFTVAKVQEGQNYEEALVWKKQGDSLFARFHLEEALMRYKTAAEKEKNFPEAHVAMARIHLNGGEGYVSAGREFSLAWEKKGYFHDKHELMNFYIQYVRYLLLEREIESSKKSETWITRAEECLREGFKLDSEQYDLHIYSAMYHWRKYNHFLGIDSNPNVRTELDSSLESMKKSIDIALVLKKENHSLHKLAILYLYEIWKTIPETIARRKEKKEILAGIQKHFDLYKTYMPRSSRMDSELQIVLDQLDSLSL